MNNEPINKSESEAETQTAQVKRYSIEKIVNFRNISLFATVLAILNQSVVLYFISPPLLSYMTISDAILRIGIVAPFLGGGIFLISDIIEDFESRLDQGKEYDGSLAQKSFRFLLGVIVIIVLIALVAVWLRDPVPRLSVAQFQPVLSNAGKASLWLIIVWAGLRYIWTLSVVRSDAEESGSISSTNLMQVIVFGVSFSIFAGLSGSIIKRPTYCEFKTSSGVERGDFLIALDQVTVFKKEERTVILNNSNIERITCTVDRPSEVRQ